MDKIDDLIQQIKDSTDITPKAKVFAEELLTEQKPVNVTNGFCPKCNTYVRWFDHFCSGCGSRIERSDK